MSNFDCLSAGRETGHQRYPFLFGTSLRKSSFSLLLLLCCIGLQHNIAQVVINEIFPDGTVELKNTGTTTVDVSGYWLCDFPDYQQINNSNLQCGNLMMAPGEILTVDDFNTISEVDGEMGLYINNAFGDPNAIIDYVEWGFSGHPRSDEAVSAGIWTAGDFVAEFGATQSLEYSGSGDTSDDWSDQDNPTICAENGGGSCDAEGGEIGGGPFEFCVGDGNADHVSDITLAGNMGTNSQWVVTDEAGTILGLPDAPEDVNFDVAPEGICLIWHLSHEDDLMGLAVNNNTADLTGCFDFSNSIAVTRNEVDGGMVTGGPYDFCVGDGNADHVSSVTVSGQIGANSQWVVTDDQGNILGLPPTPDAVNFDDAPEGVCLIWHLSYEDGLEGLDMGNNTADLVGCYHLSNPVTVNRNEVDGGTIEGGLFAFCVGDGMADHVTDITLSGNIGANSQWVVTDDNGNILGLPGAPEDVNFDVAPPGVCLIWHLSYEDGLEGLSMGNNAADLTGCYHLSNSLTVYRSEPVMGGTLEGGPYDFCVGDGNADHVSSVSLSGNVGANSQWVVTDENGNILGLPGTPEDVNFDEAPEGICLIWHLSYGDAISGLGMGNNVSELVGCYEFSNSVTVNRNEVDGGTLEGGPYSFCVGDGIADHATGVTLSGNIGANSQWVVTDDQGNILGLPGAPEDVNFDEAPAGVCLIWHLSYEDGLEGLAMGNNTADLVGCYHLSNPVTVNRNDPPSGGTLEGGPYDFCVGDGNADHVSGVTLSGNTGTNSQWVVTDDQGNILGLPGAPEDVNFDEAPEGICLIWHISYEGSITGLAVGNNTADLGGCFGLSNSVTVNRNSVEGGTLAALTGNVYNRVVIANRASGSISVINSSNNTVEGTYQMPDNGEPMYVVYSDMTNTVWVGDYNGKVVGFNGKTFQVTGSVDAGAGVFHMWLSPNNQQLWINNELDKTISIIDPINMTNLNTISIPADLLGQGYKPHDVIVSPDNAYAFVTMLGAGATEDYVVKYSTSTFQEIARAAVGTDPHVSLTSNNDKLYVASQGSGELKVLNRSDLSEVTTLSIPNAHGLGMNSAGTYLYVGNIADGGTNASYTIDLSNNTLVGSPVDAPFSAPHNYAVSNSDSKLFLTHSGPNNTVSVYSLSPTPTLETSVTVGNNPFGLVAYTYVEALSELAICAGDGESDSFDVTLSDEEGTNSGWIITDPSGSILATPPGPPFDLEGAGAGTCLVWHISYEDGLTGMTAGGNVADLTGCFDLSNAITVSRYEGDTEGGEISTNDPTTICAGDGEGDPIDVTLTGNVGTNSAWVITDPNNNILALPPGPPFDLDGAGPGTCLIWHLSFEDGLLGAEVGLNTNDLMGCYSLSNPIIVERQQAPQGGTLEGGPFEFCVNDGVADHVSGVTLSGNTGTNSQWVVTDDQGNILGLPGTPEDVNFDEAPPGTCLIWHLSYEDGLTGAEVGNNAADMMGCYELSNSIAVVRLGPNDPNCGGMGTDNYVLVGIEDLDLERNTVHSGGVGVTDENGKAEYSDESDVSAMGTFSRADEVCVNSGSMANDVYGVPATPVLPDFMENPFNFGNDMEVVIGNGETATLTESMYEDIKIGDNATVTFSGQQDVYIEDLETGNNVTLQFDQCTNLILSRKLDLGEDNQFNPGEMDVFVFAEDDALLQEGSEIYGVIYTMDKFRVRRGTVDNPTLLHGMFIGRDVRSRDYAMYWYQHFEPCDGPSINPLQHPGNGNESVNARSQDSIGEGMLDLFPNPATSTVQVTFSEMDSETAQIAIFNAANQVAVSPVKVATDQGSVAVDITHLPAGIYMVKTVLDGGEVITEKLVVVE